MEAAQTLQREGARSDPQGAHIPDAVAPPPRHPRFPLVDGLRAIAVLCVLLVHTPTAGLPDPLPRLTAQLSVGVYIFFLLSGFLLYRPFIASRAGGPQPPAVGAYAKRRALRIYPAYWVVLTALTLLPGFVSGGGALSQYALVHTLPVLGGPVCAGFSTCALAHTWSLVIEVSFYLLLPVYAVAVGRATRRLQGRSWMRAELLILTGLVGASLLARYGLNDALPPAIVAGTVLANFIGFACGMALAVVSVAAVDDPPAPIRVTAAAPGASWLAAITLFVALCAWLPEDFLSQTHFEQLVVTLVFATVALLLLIPAIFGAREHGVPRRILAHPVMAWLGLVSYGIFLWHVAFAQKFGDESFFVALPATLALSVAVAALSYYLIERPILRFKYRRLGDLFRRPTGGGPRSATSPGH